MSVEFKVGSLLELSPVEEARLTQHAEAGLFLLRNRPDAWRVSYVRHLTAQHRILMTAIERSHGIGDPAK